MSTRKNILLAAFFATLSFSTLLFGQQRPLSVVGVATVTEVESYDMRRIPGLLSSPARVALLPRVAGELLELGFTEGALVKEGQVLYRLDPLRYEAAVAGAEAAIARAEADIRRCEAALQYSQSNFNRVNALYEKKVATLDAMESAKMGYHTDQAALAAAKAALATAKASLITAKDDLKNTTIAAPITGKIGITNYTRGNYLTAASGTLATIVQLDPIRMAFSLSNRDFLELFGSDQSFKENGTVRLLDASGKEYPHTGTFEFRNNESNRNTDTVQIYVSFPNPDGALLPGSSVTALLRRRATGKCAAIPMTALMSDSISCYVYVLDDTMTVSRRDVKIGAADGVTQQILSGLKPGEKIVSTGTHKVRPGEKVAVAQ